MMEFLTVHQCHYCQSVIEDDVQVNAYAFDEDDNPYCSLACYDGQQEADKEKHHHG